jgi:hypothetical protein
MLPRAYQSRLRWIQAASRGTGFLFERSAQQIGRRRIQRGGDRVQCHYRRVVNVALGASDDIANELAP